MIEYTKIKARVIVQTMSTLRPLSQWRVIGDELIWENEASPPTEAEILDEMERQQTAIKWSDMRNERNRLLKEVLDPQTLKYFSIGQPLPEQWRLYGQALRDLPQSITDIDNVVYPIPPQ